MSGAAEPYDLDQLRAAISAELLRRVRSDGISVRYHAVLPGRRLYRRADREKKQEGEAILRLLPVPQMQNSHMGQAAAAALPRV